MEQRQTDNTQKLITFSSTLYTIAKKNAQKVGLSFQEYIRHLIIKDAEEKQEYDFVMDMETEKKVGMALNDYKQGKYTTLETDRQLQDHFDILAKKA